MDIAKFFTREESISGIEISDNALRLVVLEKYEEKVSKEKKQGEKIRIKIATEEVLPKEVVVGGIIKDNTALENSLRSLLKRAQIKVKYAILSIPADLVYSKVFSFPKNIQGERLEESMKLTTGFQLPNKTTDVYLDWESIKSSEKNEIILAAVSKSIIGEYTDILKNVGVTVIAVETNTLSIGRVVETKSKEATLIKNITPNSTQVFIIKKGNPYFTRVLPKEVIPQDKIEEEIRKISDFFESEGGFYPEEVNLMDARIIYDLYNHPAIKENNGKWLASTGAALRGLMPRSEDTLISLMPVGTEQAYEYNKALSFSAFVMNSVIALSFFFIVAFVGSWIFITSVNQRAIDQIKGLVSLPVSSEAVILESKSKSLNELLAITGDLVKKFPEWSGVIEEVKSRVTAGIIINNFAVSIPENPINFSGVAKTRNDLNVFKKNIEGSAMFTNFSIPLSNLGQKENIPFTVSFVLKNPQLVYKNTP